jgi:hypothetical protein
MFREGNHVADYDIEEVNGHYFINLRNVKNGIAIDNFKNVLLVSDDKKVLLNFDKTEIQMKGRIDITLVGQ